MDGSLQIVKSDIRIEEIRNEKDVLERPWHTIFQSLPFFSYPIFNIDLNVTENCNLKCIYCFRGEKRAVYMSLAIAKRAVDWLLEASKGAQDLKVNLMGGEPLLCFSMIRVLVPYAKLRARQMGKKIHFGCTTNCTLVTDEIIQFWKQNGMGFHCSIDGIPEIQDRNRPYANGYGSSRAAEQGIKKILAYRPEVMARSTITPMTVPYITENVKYFISLGFKNMALKPAVNCDWTDNNLTELDAQFHKLTDFYIHLLNSGEEIDIEEYTKGFKSIAHPQKHDSVPCGAGRGALLIDANGDIWPCHRFGRHCAGHELMMGKIFHRFNNDLHRAFINYNFDADVEVDCIHCPASLSCHNFCYAECLEINNSLYKPNETHCKIKALFFRHLLRAYENLRSNKNPFIEKKIVNNESEEPTFSKKGANDDEHPMDSRSPLQKYV